MKNELFRQFNNLIGETHRLVFQEYGKVDVQNAAALAKAELKGAEIRGDRKAQEKAEQKLYAVADIAIDAERETREKAEKNLAAADQLPPKSIAAHRLDVTPDVSEGLVRTLGQIEEQGAKVRAEMLAPKAPNWLDRQLAKWGNVKARADVVRYEDWTAVTGYQREYSQAGTRDAKLVVLKKASADLAKSLTVTGNTDQFLARHGLEPVPVGDDPSTALQLALNKIMGDQPAPETDIWLAVDEAMGRKGTPGETTTVARLEKRK